jgi:hypothetical protein
MQKEEKKILSSKTTRDKKIEKCFPDKFHTNNSRNNIHGKKSTFFIMSRAVVGDEIKEPYSLANMLNNIADWEANNVTKTKNQC